VARRGGIDGAEIDRGSVSFETEGRLLQELGERLVASPEVALVELIKNAYDADAPSCEVRLTNRGRELEVVDSGHGMTLDQFVSRWMKIATSHKLDEATSPLYGRRRTGQKGIGRFAVRFLGEQLTLVSVAWDQARRSKTRLEAKFDWPSIDKALDLRSAPIPYRLFEVERGAPTGTTLRIEALKREPRFVTAKRFRTGVLKIVSPLESLDRGPFGRARSESKSDPGFRVVLPGDEPLGEGVDLAAQVLERAWARLSISMRGRLITYRVTLESSGKSTEVRVPITPRISSGLHADIRFFPRRAGVFSGAPFDGREGWTWVRDNCGVAVIDHGFRIKPYGFDQDDWLSLDYDAAHNRRDWRTDIAAKNFPIPEEWRNRESDNPALNLPSNLQLVGAVFVESSPAALSADRVELTPSMDREGYLANEAFEQLGQVVRAGIEFLALEDKRELLRLQEQRAKVAAKQARADFKAAIKSISDSPTLTRGDKSRLIEHYSDLAKKLEEVEEYDREARRKLELMSLLGVVAGFMTHEATRILTALEGAIGRLRTLARRDSALASAVEEIEDAYASFRGQVDYTSTFVEAVHSEQRSPFKSGPQIKRIIEKFASFARARGIEVKSEVAADVETPGIPVALYSGVLLNLYTNALKAILAAEHRNPAPRIVFRAWNEPRVHVVEVLDTGVGVPPELAKRIFDPLFTTTSRLNNPLGSGMGIGLSLVRELLRQVRGQIRVADPPAGFSTCFRVELPRA